MIPFPNGTVPYVDEIPTTGLFEITFKISMRNIIYEKGITF
jgi:hypothetical protein